MAKRPFGQLRQFGHSLSLRHDAARQVLRFHDSAVNAVALLTDGGPHRGEDARIAL